MAENGITLQAYVEKEVGGKFPVAMETLSGVLVVRVEPEHLLPLMYLLRDNTGTHFKQLIDICGVDYPARVKRFEVVYQLLSLRRNQRIRVKVRVSDMVAGPSITEIYSNAEWFEREAWDMYGVRFENNPDLRRILTDYGFEGHPQRKDFPLTGYKEVRYDPEKQRVVYEPVVLDQEFRNFDFVSPWEGTEYVLPGDEKATDEAA